MSNEFRVCDDCQAVNLKTLIPRLKEIDPEAEVINWLPILLRSRPKKDLCLCKQPTTSRTNRRGINGEN